MNTALKILIVLTSQSAMGDTGKPTGVWFEELAVPYYAFVDAGAHVQIASINGGEAPIDPRSIKEPGANPPSVNRFQMDAKAMAKLSGTVPVAEIVSEKFDAVFMPGGHGTMWDLPRSEPLARLIKTTFEAGRVVSAVCHGPAAFVNVTLSNGRPLVEGKRLNGFTDTEEDAAGLTETVPFLLETKLRELGAEFVSGGNFEPFAVQDGNLITGQNPASSARVAELVIKQARQNQRSLASTE